MARKLIQKCVYGLYLLASLCVIGSLSFTFSSSHDFLVIPLIFVAAIGLVAGSCELYLLSRGRGSDATTSKPSAHMVLFIEDEDYDTARIVFLSCKNVRGVRRTTVICPLQRSDIQSLADEFGFSCAHELEEIETNAEDTLFTNAHTILYPDALRVAKRRHRQGRYVELNHNNHSSHALRGKEGQSDVSRVALIAAATSSFSVLTYTGGPVLVSTRDYERVTSKEHSSFSDVIASLQSSVLEGTMTSHPCCECISHNEVDNNISSRIERLTVSRRLSRLPRKSHLSFRRHIAHFYTRIFWLRPVQLVVLAASVIALLLHPSSFRTIVIAAPFVVIAQCAYSICSHLKGDHRGFFARVRDDILDCEAFLYCVRRKIYGRSASRYRIRIVPAYLCVLVGVVAYLLYAAPETMKPTSMAFLQRSGALLAGSAVLVVTYRAMYQYLTARQRAFARRRVSITGSSSYESMWIVDLTHRGAAYISDSRLDLGDDTPLVFRVPTMTGDSLITVVGRVTYCGARGDKYQVGVSFKELSQDAQDDLALYCSVIYPYHSARGINESENVAQIMPLSTSYKARRDRLTVVTYSFVGVAAISLLFALMPVRQETPQEIVSPQGRVSSLTSARYSLDSLAGEQSPTSTQPAIDGAAVSRFDLSVSQEILNVPDTGFHSGDSVGVRVTVRNDGSGPAQAGFILSEEFGADFDTNSIVMTNTGGFVPCGVTEKKIVCTSQSALAPGESRSIEFNVISRVVPSSSSQRRMVHAEVTPNSDDADETHSVQVTVTNNKYNVVLPSGDGVSVGDRVFFDANANGVSDPGEPGVGGVSVDLLKYEDINGDGVMDPGETPVIAHDVTDANGYYGTSKGTSSFQNLSPGYQYAVQFSRIPDGLTPTIRNSGSDVDPETLISQWSLNDGTVSVHYDFGVVSEIAQLATRIAVDANKNGKIDQYEKGIDVGSVDLSTWVDVNSDGKQSKDEIRTNIATSTTDSDGVVTFSPLHHDMYSTYYAMTFAVPQGYNLPTLRTQSQTGTTSFVFAEKFASMPIVLEESGNDVSGALYVDLNKNIRRDKSEFGQSSISLYLVSENETYSTTTLRNGSYVFHNVVPGDYVLGVGEKSLPNNFTVPAFKKDSEDISVSPITLSIGVGSAVKVVDLPIAYARAHEHTPGRAQGSIASDIRDGNISEVHISSPQADKIRMLTGGTAVLLALSVLGILALRKKLVTFSR